MIIAEDLRLGDHMIISQDKPLPKSLPICEGLTTVLDPWLLLFGLPMVMIPKEPDCFRHSPVDFYLQEIDGLLSLVVFIEGVGWSEAVFSAQSARTSDLQLPPANPTQGYMAHMVLVDMPTRIVRAQRTIGVSNEFSLGWYRLWSRWKDAPVLSSWEFRRKAAAIADRFPVPSNLVCTTEYHYHQPRNTA